MSHSVRSIFWPVRLLASLALFGSIALRAQLPPSTAAAIDKLVEKELSDTGAPSASIAVVKDGHIAYVKAYGNARLEPSVAARSEMRYKVGSVSKQFMAGCILLLVQDGKLALDDRVSQYLPSLTRASDVTIRELLSHTSGYQDYYPLDYVAPFMQQPVTPEGILDRWAKKALDFEPGAEWQYSNTNYVAAGRIVEKVSGMPAFSFLQSRILKPLGMASVIDLDAQSLTSADAAGYTRFALGPLRPAPPEAPGWLVRRRRTGHDGAESRALGCVADGRHASETVVAPGDDHSGAPHEWGAHRLWPRRGHHQCERTSTALTRWCGIGIRERQRGLARSGRRGSGVHQPRRLTGSGLHRQSDRPPAAGGEG